MNNQEIWKDVPDFPGYQASNFGNIRSCRNRWGKSAFKILKPCLNHNGYLRLVLKQNGKSKNLLVSNIVALTFIGPKKHGLQCAHLNGIKTDNRPENLTYCSSKENQAHKKIHGTLVSGHKSHFAKLTLDQVLEIRRLYKRIHRTKSNSVALAKIYNVTKETIVNTATGKTWRSVK